MRHDSQDEKEEEGGKQLEIFVRGGGGGMGGKGLSSQSFFIEKEKDSFRLLGERETGGSLCHAHQKSPLSVRE